MAEGPYRDPSVHKKPTGSSPPPWWAFVVLSITALTLLGGVVMAIYKHPLPVVGSILVGGGIIVVIKAFVTAVEWDIERKCKQRQDK